MEPAGAPKAPKAPEEEAGAAADEEEGIAKLRPLPNGVTAAPAMELITATKQLLGLKQGSRV